MINAIAGITNRLRVTGSMEVVSLIIVSLLFVVPDDCGECRGYKQIPPHPGNLPRNPGTLVVE